MKDLPIVSLSMPLFDKREEEYVSTALASALVAGDGPFAARCSQLLERLLGDVRRPGQLLPRRPE